MEVVGPFSFKIVAAPQKWKGQLLDRKRQRWHDRQFRVLITRALEYEKKFLKNKFDNLPSEVWYPSSVPHLLPNTSSKKLPF